MKATLSYKSKRNIIIASVIVALLAGISTAGYFYIKGNDETARAFTQDNITNGEQTQTEGGQQGNPEQNPEQPLTPDSQGDNNGDQSQGNQNQGNQPNTNNNGTPNQENGQVPSGEFVTEEVEERTVLVSEDYMVEWTPTNILANTTTSNLGIVRPIITASKTADKTAVVEGEIITYTITATNSGRADGKAVIKDTIPTGTTFVEGSIKVNNENTNYTAEDLQNGIEVNVSKQNEQGDGKTELVFQVRVNGLKSDENDKKELVGVVENKATVNEIPTEEVKTPVIIFFKNAEQSTVKAGEKILYTITLVNSSEVSGKVIVKDKAPENTTFVDGSIKVNGVEKAELTEENLKNGIEVEVKENSEVTLIFEVTVNEQNSLNDGDIIKNTAYVNEKPSEETETEFNKPVISSEKIANKTAVVEGEELTYIINVTNTGKADGKAIIKDEAPKGTKFVEGSITVNGVEKAELTEKDLKEGIEVDVPKTSDNGAGTATVSFRVIVEKGTIGKLTNEAKVNETPTEEVKTPVITFNKEVNKQVVKAGERLIYTITLKNTSEVLGKVTVRDNIPAETTFVDGSIELNEVQLKDKENNVLTKQDLEQGIEIEVAANSTVKLSFEVRVNSENNLNDGDIIKNTAYVNEKPSNEEETEFNKPIISSEKEANKTAVVAGEKLTYTIKVTNTGKADGTATVKDEVPTGTELVEGSIAINGSIKSSLTEKDLKEGIEVDVSKANENEAGTATVSFEVIVKQGTTGMLTNKATVNEIPTDEVKTPVITFSKKAEQSTVKAGEKILYTITLVNSSEVSGKVIVKDKAPENTTFVDGSIKVNGVEKAELTEENLKNGIEVEVKENSEVTLIFEVTVNEQNSLNDGDIIKNTAYVNEKPSEETETEFNKPVISSEKIANKTAVVEGEELTYIINVTNTGKADGKAIIKDEAPKGTKFVEGSITVNGVEKAELTEKDLKEGIEVDVPKTSDNGAGTATVSFRVIVEKGTIGKLTNEAKVNETPTEEVKTPVITFNKEVNKQVVKAGERLIYTITLKNTSEVLGKVTVRDNIPAETTFVDGSIELNEVQLKDKENNVLTKQDLEQGIEIEVAANSTVKLSFEVRVNSENNLNDGDIIKNTAYVNEKPSNEEETEFNKPIISSEKEANKTAVVAGEKLTYTIKVTNTGKADGTATVKDEVPTGTEFVKGSIKVNGVEKAELTEKDLKEGIKVDVPKASTNGAGTATVSFEVIVKEGTTGMLTNKATVNEIPTDEVKTPVITFSKEADKETVKVGENILYTITLVNSSEVSGKVIVKDSAPTGTEFVKGSIKVNGVEKAELTEKDLKEGIKVDVPKASTNGAGTATVSFEVTVNKNIELSSVINKAKVNDKDSNEVTTKVITYYTIEHYYNNVLDSSETVTSEEKEIGTVINGGYELKEKGKFKFVRDTGLPLTLRADPSENVIRIYYEEPNITATKTNNSKGKKLVEGDKVEYTINVTNNGNVSGDATITDEIPEGLKDISFATTQIGENDTVQLNGRTITWNVKELGKDETRTIKITATISEVEKETTITNEVKVDGNKTDETDIIVTKPIIESSKTATTILKRDNKGNVIPGQDSTKAEVGDTIIYTITATNKSDVKSDIEISDDLSNLPVTFVDGSIKVNGSASTKAKYENGKVTYKSTLAAGATVTLEFKVKVNEGTPVKTVIKNVAVVNGENKEAITTVVKKVCVKTTAETVNSLDMILVLDISGSMDENNRLADLKTAAKNLTNKLFSAQTDSTLTLIKYSTTASNPTTYQYDQKDQALKAIKNLKADGGTNFYKALDTTINTIGNNPNRNTIVVFLTDGAPTFYRKDNEPGNKLIETNSSNDNSYKDNLRPQIIQKAQELKSKPNTTIYSIGVGISGKKVQYVERDVPAELQGIFDGTKDVEDGKGKNKQTITYHYMKVKTYAEYLLNNIASSGSYINTKDINSTFDDIFKQATSSEHIYMTEDVPVTINIPETKTIISDIQVKIGNGTPTAYTLNELRNGIDGLKYTDGVGFTWTITDINTLNKELYISYTVQGIANN